MIASSSPAKAGAQLHRTLVRAAAHCNMALGNWVPAFAGVGLHR